VSEDKKFRSISLPSDLVSVIENTIEAKKAEVGEALISPEFKSTAAFVTEAARKRLEQLKQVAQEA
jgi:hypothetical protein